jgi:hypothetical protein
MEKIKNFIENLGSKPSWGYINYVEVYNNKIVITYCDSYYITIDKCLSSNDCISSDFDIAWGKPDIKFALEILDNRNEIMEMIDN